MSPSKYVYYDNIRQNVKKVPMNGLLGLPTVIVLRFTNRWKEFTYIVTHDLQQLAISNTNQVKKDNDDRTLSTIIKSL